MKTWNLTRPIGGPKFINDKFHQKTETVASVMAQNVNDAIDKFQYEACITMHVVCVTDEGADVDIPQRNSNSGWDMAFIEEVRNVC